MLRFKNDVINVKNNGKVFVENFDKAFKSESFPLALRVLHKIKGIIKLHNTGKFLEDNNFWFSFERPSKCIVAIILDLFWVSFMEYAPKCGPVSTKILPVLQCTVMHDVCNGFLCRLKIPKN